MKILFLLLLLFNCTVLLSQTNPLPDISEKIDSLDEVLVDSVKTFKLSITSNFDHAKIYSDSVLIGLTPLTDHELTEGTYNLKLINPRSSQEWQDGNLSISLSIKSDTSVNADFNYYYFIRSNPYNASVYRNDSLLGETPLRFFTEKELSGNLLLKKKNYKDYFFDLNNYNFERGADILMQSKGLETVNDLIHKDRSTQFKTKRNLLPILGTAALSVAGCILAYNFKNTANQEYDRYLVTGNSTNLQQSENNDTYFIISVVAMQAAIGGLIYFLFFDK